MLVERSSSHPVEYAIVLVVLREGRWHTVRMFDNAHDRTEHHEHRYLGDEKQPPIVTRGPVNVAMNEAETRLRTTWPAIVESWERMR